MRAFAALSALLTWIGSIALTVSATSGCMFELEELVAVAGEPADAALDGGSNAELDAEWPFVDGGVGPEDASDDESDVATADSAPVVPHTYDWKTSAWTSCSASCGGGTQTRSVWCERDDGQTVADSLCAAAKPATSQACNTAACCTPSCVAHDACGSDGCGGNCGSCVGDRSCRDGYCVWSHGNNGTATCDTICAWGLSVCVDTSSASCGVKADTTCYCW